MLQICIEVNRSVTTLVCFGRIVAGREVEMLRAVAANQHCERLELDLEKVEDVDARALASFLTIQEHAKRYSREFAISNPSPRVYELLRLVHLDRVIPVEFRPRLTRPMNPRDAPDGQRGQLLFKVEVGA